VHDFLNYHTACFFSQQYLAAADAFTEALELIATRNDTIVDVESSASSSSSSSLLRQTITLMNNRSAMYEKGNMPELALDDCNSVLEQELNHTKARTRKLRILEGLGRFHEALMEVCAIQLLFMQTNKTSLRYGLPVPPPPVPQSKMEEILGHILPGDMEQYLTAMKSQKSGIRPLPSPYTILQLLKSYSGYNAWMAQAAQDGPVEKITTALLNSRNDSSNSNSASSNGDEESRADATRVGLLLKRGRRYMYDRNYEAAGQDFELAYSLVKDKPHVQEALEKDDYGRLLEWTGMSRHFLYDIDTALAIYQECTELEPDNALLLVKQAGVQMDAGNHEAALDLMTTALELDPTAVDVLLHRSNLYMLQSKSDEAKCDLEKCLKLRPNHVMARLRLASILAALDDTDGAKYQLDQAEMVEPNSSEVQSYRGELYFTQGEMDLARQQFEKAIRLEPTNPTPYVNAAMAIWNTPPPPGQVPDALAVMRLLEQAIEVDPQFTAAYIQLGQLKLGTATELDSARQVIALYDQGLSNCRSPEEVKELCSMRALAVAQVEAAQMLKMEVFNLQ
jgi:mitochondrial import receptor subunit TOM70